MAYQLKVNDRAVTVITLSDLMAIVAGEQWAFAEIAGQIQALKAQLWQRGMSVDVLAFDFSGNEGSYAGEHKD